MINEVIERMLVQRAKMLDDKIFGEIKNIATENGIDTIVTVNEEAIVKALKKSIPTRPKILKTHDISGYKYGECECGEHIHDDEMYCSGCGQALDWSDTECPEKQDQV